MPEGTVEGSFAVPIISLGLSGSGGDFARGRRGECLTPCTGGMAVPCTQLYSGNDVATEARSSSTRLVAYSLTTFGLPRLSASLVFRVTRLWADRSLGARFADVCLAIGFCQSVAGNPLSDPVGLRRFTVGLGRTCQLQSILCDLCALLTPHRFDRRFLLGSFAGLTLHSGISAVRSIFTAPGDSLTISVA